MITNFPHCILQVNTNDIIGGAARSTWNLHQSYRSRGLNSWLAVGRKFSDDKRVIAIPNEMCKNKSTSLLHSMVCLLNRLTGKVIGVGLLRRSNLNLMKLHKAYNRWQGVDDFHFPGTKNLLTKCPVKPDIVHCRNLHGNYFDLRSLPYLSHQVPVIMTLADAWLLSGHCAHSFNCNRWITGCGNCPDLSIYPAVRKDATAINWKRKKEIYSRSQFYVTSASEWMIQKVQRSMLMDGVIGYRVIPNGVDLSCFHPSHMDTVRAKLGIPLDALVILFAANGIRRNVFKNYKALREIIAMVSHHQNDQNVFFIALGDNAQHEQIGQAHLQFVPYQKDQKIVANYYQAADIYLHPARAEVWGLTITEALACGTPVVATKVGGIPEQIEEGITGFLTPPGDSEAMTNRVLHLLKNPKQRQLMSSQAAEDAHRRFDRNRMVDDYLNFYYEIIEKHRSAIRMKLSR